MMKIKNAMRYQMYGFLRPVIIFYAMNIAVNIIFLIASRIWQTENLRMNGAQMGTLILMLVIGMNSFKHQFFLFLQNGLSRKTLYFGFLLSALLLALCSTILDAVYPLLFTNLQHTSLYHAIYAMGSGFASGLTGFAWMTLFTYATLLTGFFITTAYYRMNKLLKVLVSAGLPILLFIVIPILEGFIPSFHFYTTVFRFITWCFGAAEPGTFMTEYLPYRSLGVFAGFSAILAGLSFLLVRRATMKEA